jgi:hypothetical protein
MIIIAPNKFAAIPVPATRDFSLLPHTQSFLTTPNPAKGVEHALAAAASAE